MGTIHPLRERRRKNLVKRTVSSNRWKSCRLALLCRFSLSSNRISSGTWRVCCSQARRTCSRWCSSFRRADPEIPGAAVTWLRLAGVDGWLEGHRRCLAACWARAPSHDTGPCHRRGHCFLPMTLVADLQPDLESEGHRCASFSVVRASSRSLLTAHDHVEPPLAARISQQRRSLHDDWRRFVGDGVEELATA